MSTIDASIAPTPTGAAARLAAAHSAPNQPLTLYGSWFCPFVQRVWIVLCEKDRSRRRHGAGDAAAAAPAYQYVEINPYKKEKEFLALNPRGLVPTVVVELGREKRVLYESAVVCEWLDERYPGTGDEEEEDGGSLLPAGDGEREVFERARCRLWMNHVSTRIVPAFYRLLQWTADDSESGAGGKGETIEEARQQFLASIKAFAREMLESDAGKSGGPWFLGGRFSLVDVMLAPWAKRLFLIDHYKPGGVGIPVKGQRGEDEEVWARWDQWYEAVVERDSVKATWSDDDKYIEVYKRYADNTTQSEVAQATRKGRGLP
ncbi:hypothetical protein VTK26DRAFT_9471 [Humicola hyalothermophila]